MRPPHLYWSIWPVLLLINAVTAAANISFDYPTIALSLKLYNKSNPLLNIMYEKFQLNMTSTQVNNVTIVLTDINEDLPEDFQLHVIPARRNIVKIYNSIINKSDIPANMTQYHRNMTIEAVLVGFTEIYVESYGQRNCSATLAEVYVTRQIGTLDYAFQVAITIFVWIMYISFGAVLELETIKSILMKPVGASIGFVGQYLVMPVLSYFIGSRLFPQQVELRLGLFFVGSTPGGGASNIMTLLFNGNLNLSIAMTAISNLAAFGMMPLWLFTLGAVIFKDGHMIVPYKAIASLSCSLLAPISLGLILQKYAPKMRNFIEKVIKPILLALLLCMICSSLYINSHIFKFISLQIIIGSCALPWCGYFIGWLMAYMCRQSSKDNLTIAIETGQQNSAIAYLMANYVLPQPQADIASIIPVVNSVMTPMPLLLIYIITKFYNYVKTYMVTPAFKQKDAVLEKQAMINVQ